MKLKKSLAIFLCLALLLSSGAGAAFASAKVSAKILSLEGDVQVVRAGGEKAFKAFVNMRLTEGDRIITGTNGRAEIQMDDELIITLVENTRIYLSELRGSAGSQQSSIDLQAGGVGAAVNKKLEESSRFEIKTPTAVMGVRGTEFFTQYFAGNVDVRVVDGFVEVTVELSENGQVAGGGGSSWSGTGDGSGASTVPAAETFTFQLGPLEQVLFAEGDQGAQLPGQIGDLSLLGLPEKFIERIQEIEKDQPGKIPESILDKIEEAVQGALDKLREQEAAAQGTRGEYDFRYTAHIIDGDVERGLPGFAPEDMDIPPLEPEPVDSGGGGGDSGDSSGGGTSLPLAMFSITEYGDPMTAQILNLELDYEFIEYHLESEIPGISYSISNSDDNVILPELIEYTGQDGEMVYLLFIEIFEEGQTTLTIKAQANGYEIYTRSLLINVGEDYFVGAVDDLYALYTVSAPGDLNDKTPFDGPLILTTSVATGNEIAYIYILELAGDLGLEAIMAAEELVYFSLEDNVLMIQAKGTGQGPDKVHIKGSYNGETIEIVIDIQIISIG